MEAILLVDHGTRRGNASSLLERIAEGLREQLPRHCIEIAHMEFLSPTIAEAFEACVAAGATRVVVQPYFLAPGHHTKETIPSLVDEAARDHSGVEVRIAEPLGFDAGLVDLVRRRVEDVS